MNNSLQHVRDTNMFKALRNGLMRTFPIILTGCFACVLANLPIRIYADFIAGFGGGILKTLFDLINNCCVGCVALWMLLLISYSYGNLVREGSALFFPITSMACYFVFVYEPGVKEDMITRFGSKWTFTALVVTALSCLLLRVFLQIRDRRGEVHIYASGADNTYLLVLKHLVPVAEVITCFGLIRVAAELLFHGTDFYNFGGRLAENMFSHIGSDYLAGFLFVLFVHILWFFGIHGSNMLDGVALSFEADMGSGTILSKTFVDVFVLMGGCGVSLCILAAILLVGRSERNRRLSKLSIFPGIFNINETVIYGLPLFFEVTLLVPFLLAPTVAFTVSYAATAMGLVPYVSDAVTWQMPVFFSGYLATGSLAGSILQAMNLCIGVLLYIPFIRKLEQHMEADFNGNIEQVANCVRRAEADGVPPALLLHAGEVGDTAKGLAEDLRHAVEKAPQELELFYQPQMYYDGTLCGAEALLRWKHPAGNLYPPMVIALAEETQMIDSLGLLLIRQSCAALQETSSLAAQPFKLSVNLSASQLKNPEFADQVETILKDYDFHGSSLVFELTEQASLTTDPIMNAQVDRLTEMGIAFSLDDFGMGHSSLMYLQEHHFRYVKIDGSITKEILTNDSCRQILSSMVDFSARMGITLIAEYVETSEQVAALHELGCDCYQGYYYSKAIPFDQWKQYLQREGEPAR